MVSNEKKGKKKGETDRDLIYKEAIAILKAEVIRARKEKEVNAFKIAGELNSAFNFMTTDDTETIYVYDDGIYTMKGVSFIKKWCQEFLGSRITTHKVNEIINHIRRMTYVTREKIESMSNENSNLICCKNGILNLDTKELKDFTPEIVIFNKIPIIYNPEIKYDKWEKFVMEIVSVENIFTLRKFFGYCLRRDCIYEKALVFHGIPGSGKSRIIFILTALLGEENTSSISLQSFETDKFRRVRIDKKLANLCADISKKELIKTSEFKKSVSGDRITGERKGENSYDFTPYAKFVYSANELPISYDLTDGFFDRLVLIETTNKIRGTEKEIRAIEKQFTENGEIMSGILNWAVEGYGLLKNFAFKECSGAENRKIWIKNSDSVQAFIDECVLIDIDGVIGKIEFFQKYLKYCDKNNLIKKSYEGFCKQIKKKLDVETYNPVNPDEKDKQIHCWKGVKLKNI